MDAYCKREITTSKKKRKGKIIKNGKKKLHFLYFLVPTIGTIHTLFLNKELQEATRVNSSEQLVRSLSIIQLKQRNEKVPFVRGVKNWTCYTRMWRNLNLCALLIEMQNGVATVENIMAVLPNMYIFNHHKIQLVYFQIYAKIIESRDSNRYLYTNVYSSIINSTQKVKTTQLSTNWWMK